MIVQRLYFIKPSDPEVLSSHKTTLEKNYFQEPSLSPVKKFGVIGEFATFLLESYNNQPAFNRLSINKGNFSLVHVTFCISRQIHVSLCLWVLLEERIWQPQAVPDLPTASLRSTASGRGCCAVVRLQLGTSKLRRETPAPPMNISLCVAKTSGGQCLVIAHMIPSAWERREL